MPLDITLTMPVPTEVYANNITHNLRSMASALGVHEQLWKPERVGITTASQVIPYLEEAIRKMKDSPDFYRAFDSPNGFGKYDDFLAWLQEYLVACTAYPTATVTASR